MDALKLLSECRRMCMSYTWECYCGNDVCPLQEIGCFLFNPECNGSVELEEKAVKIVEKWSKEHPN